MKKSLFGIIVFSVLPLLAFAGPPGFTSLDLVSITGGTPPTTDPILTWDADDLFINFNANSDTDVSGLNLTYNFDFTSTSSVVGDTFLLSYLFPDTAHTLLSTTIVDPEALGFGPGDFAMDSSTISVFSSSGGWTGSNGFNGIEVSYVAPATTPDATPTWLLVGASVLAMAALRRRMQSAA
jgi:hypothetical protein